MTSLTVAAVVLAAGWVFVRRWLRTRYMALKEAGHPQYFAAAVAGVCVFGLGASLHAAATKAFLWYPTWMGNLLAVVPQTGDALSDPSRAVLTSFAAGATWALGLAVVLPWILNLPIHHDRRLLRAVMKRANALDAVEHIYAHSLECGIPIAITLKNRKVYIGYPVASSTMDIEKKWLVLVPVMSGYRDEASELFLPISYGKIQEDMMERAPAEANRLAREFRVVLAFSEIVSIQAFNIETYFVWFKSSSPAVAEAAEAGAEAPHAGAEPEESPASPSEMDESSTCAVEETSSVAQGFPDRQGADDFSPDERFRLKAYNAYVALLAASVVAAPYSVLMFAGLLAVGGLAAAAAIQEKDYPSDM